MGTLLDTVHSPADIKNFSIPQLETLAQEIRERLIVSLSKTGGHLGPNLGVVELTLAMHYVFDTPTDKFVFDVSHQAYIHKLLTGRRERFETIRQPGGLNGFMLRTESEHDIYGAGHAGTALSAALGMAVARDLAGGCEHVVALAGDAAFTNGISFEALNNIADQTKRLIVVLNDNEWSIDRNVGAIAKYLHKIVTNEHVTNLHESGRRLLEKLGGKAAVNVVRRAEEAAKGLLWPSVFFEEFGLTYYGPLDGHNLSQLIETFKFLKQQDKPVILHAITQKGRGFQPALDKQKKFHGLGPYDPETGETKPVGQRTYSEVFADTLVALANENDKIVAITGAMPNGTALDLFRPHHPKRYFDVGIAEEHAVVFAAGMATRGYKPYCAIYSTFLQRAFDPIVHDVCLQNLPVVFCMDRGSLSGDDGATHHGLFDISYLRGIPNIIHMDPADEDELADMMYTAMLHEGPSAIRYPRGTGPNTPVKAHPQALEIGKAKVERHGDEIAILGLGQMLPMAHELADVLEREGHSVAVINPRFVKPLDREVLAAYAKNVTAFVTFEDHVLMGGFGSAVLEALSEMGFDVPVVRIGWPDEFIEHGKVDQLREKYGVSAAAALEKLAPYLRHRGARRLVTR
ncbi:1-deoxy-D-xylulose-5-phosphate synthase [Silvibacterium acidisoli]|uniref:1-deoxy-D-xylulose-5-phosphate synthase n=1 Tax=Acidobacteriaceae bacterium ZG23-2 TaxID=2883246 RepID=UPI00406D4505